MQFLDEITIAVQAGDGGDGAVSFRREKFVEKGGPDGGDGGNGGDVLVAVDPGLNTLASFSSQKTITAERGEAGKPQKRHGKDGKPALLLVPQGTVINDAASGAVLLDSTELKEKESRILFHGGRGGYGNAHFTGSTRQTPRFAERGESGESGTITLTLKLIADVGLIGLPNAGKSTFLSVVTRAQPKIAAYPFTTLTPNLGIAEVDKQFITIADIPGLIEGASKGKGLGHQFLRHIERTRLLLHLIDATGPDPEEAYQTVRRELAAYSKELARKPELVVLTKADAVSANAAESIRNNLAKKVPRLFAVSAVAHEGIIEVLRAAQNVLRRAPAERPPGPPHRVWTTKDVPDYFEIRVKKNKFIVKGAKAERWAQRYDTTNDEALSRLLGIYNKMGILKALKKHGAKPGDRIQVGASYFTFREP